MTSFKLFGQANFVRPNTWRAKILHLYITAISRHGGYEVYKLASNMPKSPPKKNASGCKLIFLSLLLSNQKKILKTEIKRQNFKGAVY